MVHRLSIILLLVLTIIRRCLLHLQKVLLMNKSFQGAPSRHLCGLGLGWHLLILLDLLLLR